MSRARFALAASRKSDRAHIHALHDLVNADDPRVPVDLRDTRVAIAAHVDLASRISIVSDARSARFARRPRLKYARRSTRLTTPRRIRMPSLHRSRFRLPALTIAAVVTASTAVSIAGCSSDASSPADANDAGASDGASSDTRSTDTSTTDTSVDASVDTADSGCAPLGSNPVDVYVDKSAATASVGTAACPFHTLGEATALDAPATGTMTIHIADVPSGGSAPVDYAEGGLGVKSGVILVGAGATRVKISGSAACSPGGSCALWIDGGGSVAGVTVSGGGVATSVTTGTAVAAIKTSVVTGASGDGIRVLGAADLGPNIQAHDNAGNGLTITGAGSVHVIAGNGVMSSFDSNGGDGIHVGGAARLTFDGGSASRNHGNGVVLGSTVTGASLHAITALVARSNGTAAAVASGLVLQASSSAKIRSSVLLANTGAGMVALYSGTNVLDIGPAGDSGNNAFGSGNIAIRNKVSICVEGSGASSAIDGDAFNQCPPPQTSFTGTCASLISGQVSFDIAYVRGPATPPFVIGTCSVGP
jgi:hypothetical protein